MDSRVSPRGRGGAARVVVWIGLVLMVFGVAAPAVAVLGTFLAFGSVVVMLVRLPRHLRAHRHRRAVAAGPAPARLLAVDAPRPELDDTDHSADYDPDVVRTSPFGSSEWRCRCGGGSTGIYADPANAHAAFLAHKYGLPWPARTGTSRSGEPAR